MKYVVGLCLLTLVVPVLASDPGDPDPAFEPQAWEGKHSDELIAAWGEPRRTKQHGEGGKVLVYRLRFFAIDLAGETIVVWSDAGIECSRVIATQKVKFYADAEGIVRGQVFDPRKWKQKKP